MKIDDIKDTLAEIAKMTDDQRDVALRLSGECLAEIDTAMRTADDEERTVLAEGMADMALCHTDLMFRAGLYNDAYATAVMAMMTLSIYDKFDVNHLSSMGLCVVALYSLEQIASKLTPDDETKDHVNAVITFLISLTYSQYCQIVSSLTSPWLNRAYELLRDLTPHVMHPTIQLTVPANPDDVVDVDPLHPLQIFQDIAGRSVALGLIN